MWKGPVVNASDRIFPGLACHDRKKEFYDIGNRIESNLPLQIALYTNVRFFPVWFVVIVYNLDVKYSNLSEVYKYVTISVFVIISLLEISRLYLGYLGNLAEKIPELACFWLISTLLQLPLELFLLFNNSAVPSLSEKIVNGIALFLLVMEIITGTVALKRSADHHARRFYLAQLYGIEDKVN